MASIPSGKKLATIVGDVAFELRLPWRIQELLRRAFEASAAVEDHAVSSGLSSEQMDQRIYAQVKKAGKGMDALPPDLKQPTPEQIEAALTTFSGGQWKVLVESFRLEEANAVCVHLDDDANRLRLTERFGAEKVHAMLGAAALRAIELERADGSLETVVISDPDLALVLRDLALEANVKGKGHPTKGPPMAEQAKAPHISRRLGERMSPYMIEQWWKRMEEELPFQQYAADRGADDEEGQAAIRPDYWLLIRDTAAYKKYLRAHGRGTERQRDD